ncbi:putative hydro-lyase [Oceanobacillus locisalsi]|uniref:Putative hydro-lyase ACFQ19_07990 n=1 Tax=Oceanobacillus locisalsi TaxID=546107 RepID=A0ABW3NHI7_9BACI
MPVEERKRVIEKIRHGGWTTPTSGVLPGYAQANLVVLDKAFAFEFLLYCQRNPKSCPVLDVTDPGIAVPALAGKDADIRSDIPKYHIYRSGEHVETTENMEHLWTDTSVAFLLGCSFTFEEALIQNGIAIRHNEENCNVPMFKTNIDTVPAGLFSGPMVVSMRPMKRADAIRAVQVTSRFPDVHGAPVHIGDPSEIGIINITQPDYGDAVTLKEGEIPVFWACGVTPQAAAKANKLDMITHAPGHMFLTDIKNETLGVL